VPARRKSTRCSRRCKSSAALKNGRASTRRRSGIFYETDTHFQEPLQADRQHRDQHQCEAQRSSEKASAAAVRTDRDMFLADSVAANQGRPA
jgi:hypothetical protein